MSFDLTATELAIAGGATVVVVAYVVFILVPALSAYGRVWEKLAAGFLSLYVLGTLLGIGTVVGLAVVWSYDQYA